MFQDFELLRRISGCQELLDRENFDRMWYWLYPVAFTLSRDWINPTWCSTSPKWIEGFVTKEEAESSLQGLRSIQQPGTFILRFPTSRSWPHPDAGSLIVTYIGSDYNLHHRMLSLDSIYRLVFCFIISIHYVRENLLKMHMLLLIIQKRDFWVRKALERESCE